jgi:hypothetical protein
MLPTSLGPNNSESSACTDRLGPLICVRVVRRGACLKRSQLQLATDNGTKTDPTGDERSKSGSREKHTRSGPGGSKAEADEETVQLCRVSAVSQGVEVVQG